MACYSFTKESLRLPLLIALNTFLVSLYLADFSTGAACQLQEILKLQNLIIDFYKVSGVKGTTISA